MTKIVSESLVDDFDGETPADHKVSFMLNGIYYDIDLTTEHKIELEDALQPFIDVARRVSKRMALGEPAPVGRPAKIQRRTRPNLGITNMAEVRTWAKGAGIQLSDRGAIPMHVKQAFVNRDAATAAERAGLVVEFSTTESNAPVSAPRTRKARVK